MTLLRPGDLFAQRFEIDRPAGSGGMGSVYRARDLQSGDIVALKLLHVQNGPLADPERFVREARLLSELSHPGIVAYVAHGQTPEGQRFLAMEWLDGEDLSARLLRGPLPLQEALLLFKNVTEALAVAHRRGVIHRDVKPSNLFLPGGDLGRVKLLDFGLARRIESSLAMTRTGAVMGTPTYMAPEQARGLRELTPAADVFSLGCLFYECLAGDPPFLGEHVAAVLARVLFEEPPPLSRRRPGLPHSVEAMLLRMLVKDPALRIPDAPDLLDQLSAVKPVPEGSRLPSPSGPVRITLSFAENQQILSSLVIAAPPRDAQMDATVALSDELLERERRAALLSELRAMGARAEFLQGGMLVVTVPQTGSATDQAAAAARAALLIKERWPAAEVAVATGRGAAQGLTAGGEVADRAAAVLGRRMQHQGAAQGSGVWLDELSAGLLGPRFAVLKTPEGLLLRSEDAEVDESRPLLGRPTPCVGREAELGTLESQLRGCIEESSARVILITAMPGVGKSRLRHEFLRRILRWDDAVTVLQGRGDLMRAGAPYGIVGQTLRRLCGVVTSEPAERQAACLRSRINARLAASERERVALFLGELLGLPGVPAEHPLLRPAREDPRIMRDQIRRAFLDWLAAELAVSPVLMLLDDLHWGDALSIGLLQAALDELRGMPLCLVALARPEVHERFPELQQKTRLIEIPLAGLSRKACERLIHHVLGQELRQGLGQVLPAATVAQLVEQAAGNALYLEELIRAAAEGHTGQQPATVLAMLQARIGRFDSGPRRAVLAASVFGRTFSRGGVAALLDVRPGSSELADALRTLCEAEVIQQSADSRLSGETAYGFRHALVRDAAYRLLTDADLEMGHRLAAGFLEGAGERDPVIIAEHYELGNERACAAALYARAAEQFYERHEQHGALRCADRALACGLPESVRDIMHAIRTILAFWEEDLPGCTRSAPAILSKLEPGGVWWCRLLSAAILAAGQSGDEECLSVCSRALLQAEPHPIARVPYVEALGFLCNVSCITGQIEQMTMLLRRLELLVPDGGDTDLLSVGWKSCSVSFCGFLVGDDPYQPALAGRCGIAAFHEAGDLRGKCAPQSFVAMLLMGLGESEESERLSRTAFEQAVRIGQPFVIDYSRLHLGFLLSGSDRPEWQKEAAELAHAQLSGGAANSLHTSMAHGVLARVAAKQGDFAGAVASAARAYELLRFFPPYWYFVAPAYLHALVQSGQVAEARKLADEGMAALARTRSGGVNDIAVRLACAQVLAESGAIPEAYDACRAALTRLEERAARIPDAAARSRYLRRVPENARLQELAQGWGVR